MKTQQFKQQQTTMWQICRNDVVRFEHEKRNDRKKTLSEGAGLA